MKLNNKGYTIVELFAVILITSLVIFPLITTLVNNIEINDREQKRLAASNIAQGTLDSLNRLSFNDIENLVTTANTNNDYFMELNYDECDVFTTSGDQLLCQNLFASIWNNVSFTSTEFRVFVVNYNLPSTYQSALVNNSNGIPQAVKDVIASYPTSTAANPELYRVIIWIEYDTETSRVLTLKGLLSNE